VFKKTIFCLAMLLASQAFATAPKCDKCGSSGSTPAGGTSSSTSGSTSGVDVRLGDVIAESGDSSAGASVNGVAAQSGDSISSAKTGDSLSSAKSGDSLSKATGGKSASDSKAIVGDTKATGGKSASDSKAIVGDTKATGGKSASESNATGGKSTSESKAQGGKSSSDSTSGAVSGSKSGDVSADVNVENNSGGGAGGAGGQGGSGGSATGGSGGKIEQNTKYFNVTFPEPVSAAAIAAGNCGASFSVAAGWNFFSWASSNSNKAAECRLMPLIVTLYNQCQYKSGSEALHSATRGALKETTGYDMGDYVAPEGIKNWSQCQNGVPQTTRVYSEAELAAMLAAGAKPTNVVLNIDARGEGGHATATATSTTEAEEAAQCSQQSQMGAIIAGKPYKPKAKTRPCK